MNIETFASLTQSFCQGLKSSLDWDFQRDDPTEFNRYSSSTGARCRMPGYPPVQGWGFTGIPAVGWGLRSVPVQGGGVRHSLGISKFICGN